MRTIKDAIKTLDYEFKNLPEAYIRSAGEEKPKYSKFQFGNLKLVEYQSKDFYNNLCLSVAFISGHCNYSIEITRAPYTPLDRIIFLSYNYLKNEYYMNNSIVASRAISFSGDLQKDELFNLSMSYDFLQEAFEIKSIVQNNIDIFLNELKKDF